MSPLMLRTPPLLSGAGAFSPEDLSQQVRMQMHATKAYINERQPPIRKSSVALDPESTSHLDSTTWPVPGTNLLIHIDTDFGVPLLRADVDNSLSRAVNALEKKSHRVKLTQRWTLGGTFDKAVLTLDCSPTQEISFNQVLGPALSTAGLQAYFENSKRYALTRFSIVEGGQVLAYGKIRPGRLRRGSSSGISYHA